MRQKKRQPTHLDDQENIKRSIDRKQNNPNLDLLLALRKMYIVNLSIQLK